MRYFKDENVLEAAKERIRFVFGEFGNVFVAHSGGKDSTVTFHLALEVAKEMGRTPLPVLFIDQEAEFTQTIDVIKSVMYRDDVEPHWLQCPIFIFNATSHEKDWIGCWEEGAEWLRDKDPVSIKENNFGTTRIKEMFSYYPAHLFPKEPFAMLGGVRCEESPTRRAGLTGARTYKWVTWGKKLKAKNHYTFYPLYDWSYSDIWKAIHEHGWQYNEVYDQQYRHGVPEHGNPADFPFRGVPGFFMG